MINELKKILVGKKICSVEQGYGEGCICRLAFSNEDGENKQWIQIHGNDLAHWIENINKAEDGSIICNSLGELFVEFSRYLGYMDENQIFFKVGIAVVINTSVMLKCLETEQIFRCTLNNEWEKNITKNENFFSLARDAILLGPFYKTAFEGELSPPIDYK